MRFTSVPLALAPVSLVPLVPLVSLVATCAFMGAFISACANDMPDEGSAMNAGSVVDGNESESAFSNQCAGGPTVKGVDVSIYQSDIDWAAVASDGVKYAFIRVSDGAHTNDSKFRRNWDGAKQNGVLRGAYQFFRANQDPIAEANVLIAAVGSMGPGDLPPVLDVETSDGQSPATVAAHVHQWLDHVEAALGVRPIIYTGPYFWRDNVGGADETRSPLWIAHYGTDCPFVPPHWSTWTLHQYGSTGHVRGINANVDMDVFNGTEEQLRALANGTPASSGDDGSSGVVGGAAPDGHGYWLVGADGGVFSFGASFFGSLGGTHMNAPAVGMASTASGQGYWLAAKDGGVFAFGDAGFHGSMGGTHLNQPIVGIAGTPSGGGYWLVASDGGVFAFGDAGFHGSMGGTHLNQPVVGIAATPSGRGYWLVARDGGIFSFGDAGFHGSTGAMTLNAPIVGMASTSTGRGYHLVASDGGVFTFGDAHFLGSMGGTHLDAPIKGIASTPSNRGYWLFAKDGGVFTFGDAPFRGSAAGP